MDFQTYDLNGARIAELTGADNPLKSDRDAVDVIGASSPYRPDIILIPTRCLDGDFFRLKTRIAGEFIQKFVTYRLRLAILGDISDQLRESSALQDFVRESNNGSQVWFVKDTDELKQRLGTQVEL